MSRVSRDFWFRPSAHLRVYASARTRTSLRHSRGDPYTAWHCLRRFLAPRAPCTAPRPISFSSRSTLLLRCWSSITVSRCRHIVLPSPWTPFARPTRSNSVNFVLNSRCLSIFWRTFGLDQRASYCLTTLYATYASLTRSRDPPHHLRPNPVCTRSSCFHDIAYTLLYTTCYIYVSCINLSSSPSIQSAERGQQIVLHSRNSDLLAAKVPNST